MEKSKDAGEGKGQSRYERTGATENVMGSESGGKSGGKSGGEGREPV